MKQREHIKPVLKIFDGLGNQVNTKYREKTLGTPKTFWIEVRSHFASLGMPISHRQRSSKQEIFEVLSS